MLTSVILGAGFSYVAGLPLAKDLITARVFIPSGSFEKRRASVLQAWEEWREKNPDGGSEQFLSELYKFNQLSPLELYKSNQISPVPWQWAVELIAAVLATPIPADFPVNYNPRYSGRITAPVRVELHKDFWDIILQFRIAGLITTNYDILAERGLRYRQMKRIKRPGFYYGGVQPPQLLKGLAQPFSVRNSQRIIELKSGIPLFKLHGSLNWSLENGHFIMYQDLRAAFRNGGTSLIVPPVLEKETPDWLQDIWKAAADVLKESCIWLVCGYSLPSYDVALVEYFNHNAVNGNVNKIILIDPMSEYLKSRWVSIAPNAEIICLPGLPEALDNLKELLKKI
jgi:hypothetical protein